MVNDISDENNDYKKKSIHLDIGEGKDLVHRIENSVDGNPLEDRGNSNADDIHRRLDGVDSWKTCSLIMQ